MEGILGGLAFAGVIAAHLLALVAAHDARWNNGDPGSSDPYGVSGQWKLALVAVALLTSLIVAGAQATTNVAENHAAGDVVLSR
jgi:hypothetical protein